MPITIEGVEPSVTMRARIRAEGGPVFLAFSRGKDSHALWLQLRAEGFDEIIPVHLEMVPGLRFVEESLCYFERAFGTPIVRSPSSEMFRRLHAQVYQPPQRRRVLEAGGLMLPTRRQLFERIAWERGLERMPWIFDGSRASDTMTRRTAVVRGAAWQAAKRLCWGLWDWRKQEVNDLIEASGIARAVDYDGMKRTFGGIEAPALRWVRDRYPDDYARILEWFPLADVQFVRSPWTQADGVAGAP